MSIAVSAYITLKALSSVSAFDYTQYEIKIKQRKTTRQIDIQKQLILRREQLMRATAKERH